MSERVGAIAVEKKQAFANLPQLSLNINGSSPPKNGYST